MACKQIGQCTASHRVMFFACRGATNLPTWLRIWDDLSIKVHRGTHFSFPSCPSMALLSPRRHCQNSLSLASVQQSKTSVFINMKWQMNIILNSVWKFENSPCNKVWLCLLKVNYQEKKGNLQYKCQQIPILRCLCQGNHDRKIPPKVPHVLFMDSSQTYTEQCREVNNSLWSQFV